MTIQVRRDDWSTDRQFDAIRQIVFELENINQTASSAPTDHGALTGLADDDHPQYLTQTEADALYSVLGHTHAQYTENAQNEDITGNWRFVDDPVQIDMVETTAPTDEGRWRHLYDSGNYIFLALLDDNTPGDNILSVVRTAGVINQVNVDNGDLRVLTGGLQVLADDTDLNGNDLLNVNLMRVASGLGTAGVEFIGDTNTSIRRDLSNNRLLIRFNDGTNDAQLSIGPNGIQLFPFGDATEVAIGPSGELDTGWFFPATDTQAWSCGGTERMRLTTAALTILGNTVWHAGNDGDGSGLDSDTIDGFDTEAGTFTATYNGFSGSVTAQGRYFIIGNLKIVTVEPNSGTSNAASFTITGFPASLAPLTFAPRVVVNAIDNGTNSFATAGITSTTISLALGVSTSANSWTNSGTKGLNFALCLAYV